jgi:phage FluMu gp28-like protein
MSRTKREPAVGASAPGPALQLLPYQQRWVEDRSPLKIVVKGRQIGFSFAATLGAVLKCLERKTTWVFLSKGERQSRLLMERVHEHIHSCGIVAQAFESSFFEGTMTRQLEARFSNGSVIYGLPANPDTARGYSGHVTLDEFAFHLDADKIYAALYPTITRGYSLEVISTPNGQQGKFYELAKEAGLTEGEPESAGIRNAGLAMGGRAGAEAGGREGRVGLAWSGHWCDIAKAVRQGLEIDLELLRSGVDEEAWRQEFCCEFLSGGSQWIPPALFEQCVSTEASVEPVILSAEREGSRTGQRDEAADPERALYAGWDIARRRDLSVIWIAELVGDVTWTRGVIEMRNLPTPDQLRQARAVLPFIRRMEIDQSGMGLAIFEALEREFPGKVEGVQFTTAKKETLAVRARRRMEELKVRLPDDDGVRQSFRSVKKSSNALGQSRFDAEHDSKYGHADHWWAFCLAEAAAEQQSDPYHLADTGEAMGSPIAAGMYRAAL